MESIPALRNPSQEHATMLDPRGDGDPPALASRFARNFLRLPTRHLPHRCRILYYRGPDVQSPVFSPDGRWIAYVSDLHTLKKVPIEGGAAMTLIEGNFRYLQLTWTDNGKILLTRFDPDQPGVIYALPEAGGRPTPVAGKPEQATQAVGNPQALPGGRLVLLAVEGTRPALAVQSLETGERRILAQALVGISGAPKRVSCPDTGLWEITVRFGRSTLPDTDNFPDRDFAGVSLIR